jgi:hypothetical protein
MKRRVLLAVAFALLASAGARAVDLSSQVLQRLESPAVLQGEFEQSRSLKGFRNPLVSRGEFVLARAKGIVWDTRQPFASTLVITRDKLLARRADGTIATQLDAAREPALRLINELMFALLGGDLQVLARQFRIEGELRGDSGWKLVLTPTDALLKAQFESISLEGDKQVKLVRIAERNGDITQIRFQALRASPELAAEAAKRFEDVQHGG